MPTTGDRSAMSDDLHYSHAVIAPLEAEQLLDALSQVTDVPAPFTGYPRGLRANQVPAPAPASNGHAASSSNLSGNLSGQEMAQNSNPQGQQARPNPQQAARRLQNASQLGAVDGETGLDGGVDAALSALRNRSTASRLALNLIV